MYKSISLEEGNYVLSEIEKQLNKENIELDLEQQIKTLDVYAGSIKELTTKGYEVTEFTKIASLCNAGFIFPFTKDKEKNLNIIISVLLEMTSKVDGKIEITECDPELKNKIAEKIAKIKRDPRISPYNLGRYLQQLYNQNKHLVK